MTATDTPIDVQPAEQQRLDDLCDHQFTAEFIGDGYAVDCSGCGPHVVNTFDDAIAFIEHHRRMHDQESREVWV